MPLKKRAADSDAPTTRAKSRKSDQSKNTKTAQEAEHAESDDSVEVTGERQASDSHDQEENVDNSHDVENDLDLSDKKVQEDPHTYVTFCLPSFEFESRGIPREKWAKEHNEKKCACYKKRDDGWSVMRKGKQSINSVEMYEISYRNPDNFNMYVYNDFHGYGYQEIMENHLSEFNKILNKKDGKTEDLWTIMESLGTWINNDSDGTMFAWFGYDDADRFWLTKSLLGFAFLTCLNRMDREGDFKVDSRYKDLSLVISLWVRMSKLFGVDTDDPFDTEEAKSQDFGDDTSFNMLWLRYLLVYCMENEVPIKGIIYADKLAEGMCEKVKGKVKLPAKKADRFEWKKKYKEYTSRFGHGGKIGGNAFRIVDWTRSERASYAYDKKDPIDDEAIKALKSGLVLQIL